MESRDQRRSGPSPHALLLVPGRPLGTRRIEAVHHDLSQIIDLEVSAPLEILSHTSSNRALPGTRGPADKHDQRGFHGTVSS
jgi:hypothetical protein